MIYLDTSVALAQLLSEDRRPPRSLWREDLVSSRLLQYELWTRLNARGLSRSHRFSALDLTSRVAFLELNPQVLQRALEPFPVQVRTLDALHLASALYLLSRGQRLQMASYDDRLKTAAESVGLESVPPSDLG
ncbi:MAG: PIN domain-containing protein [Acidobacteriota bacterium]